MSADLVKVPRSINHQAIAMAERLLADLREGKVQAVGFAIVNDDRSIATSYSFQGNLHPLTAAASQLLYRLNKA